jgi:excisionase family DNA binding protein
MKEVQTNKSISVDSYFDEKTLSLLFLYASLDTQKIVTGYLTHHSASLDEYLWVHIDMLTHRYLHQVESEKNKQGSSYSRALSHIMQKPPNPDHPYIIFLLIQNLKFIRSQIQLIQIKPKNQTEGCTTLLRCRSQIHCLSDDLASSSGMKNFLDYDGASKFTGYSSSYLKKLVCYKEIPFNKLGRRVLFKADELENWLEERLTKSAERM